MSSVGFVFIFFFFDKSRLVVGSSFAEFKQRSMASILLPHGHYVEYFTPANRLHWLSATSVAGAHIPMSIRSSYTDGTFYYFDLESIVKNQVQKNQLIFFTLTFDVPIAFLHQIQTSE